jgi:hypothetical protein
MTMTRRRGINGVLSTSLWYGAPMPKHPEVDAWLAKYDNPMKPVVVRVRDILLAADARLDECIKWSTPTFTYKGNLASFNPRSKKHASLLFHVGAKIPGKHPRLEGTGDTARTMAIRDLADADAARPALVALVKAWIAMQDAGPVKPAPAKKAKRPAKRPAKKPPKRR